MDEYKGIKKSLIRTFALAASITILVGLLIGKVVEANIGLEIGKGLLLAAVIGVCACVVFVPFIYALDTVRDKMFPTYGKKWGLKGIKNGFKSN